jgi:hypothetical protein
MPDYWVDPWQHEENECAFCGARHDLVNAHIPNANRGGIPTVIACPAATPRCTTTLLLNGSECSNTQIMNFTKKSGKESFITIGSGEPGKV